MSELSTLLTWRTSIRQKFMNISWLACGLLTMSSLTQVGLAGTVVPIQSAVVKSAGLASTVKPSRCHGHDLRRESHIESSSEGAWRASPPFSGADLDMATYPPTWPSLFRSYHSHRALSLWLNTQAHVVWELSHLGADISEPGLGPTALPLCQLKSCDVENVFQRLEKASRCSKSFFISALCY